MAISMKKWVLMTDEERVSYALSGKVIASMVMGIRSDAKVNDDCAGSAVIQYRATIRGILFGIGDSEIEAIQDAYKNLSEYTGELPA